jgi:hypothetical protein
MVYRVRKVKRTDGDDDVRHDAEHALKVVGLLVAEEGANSDD